MAAMLDDHHLVGTAMTAPAFVAAEVAVLAEFGTRTEAVIAATLDDDLVGAGAVVMVAATLDDRGFSTGNRRRRDGDRAKGCNNVSKLLHGVLSSVERELNTEFPGT